MYIKKVKKRNKGSDKVYEYLHLVESYHTLRGSRQRLVLNLGALDIPPESYKALANSIENRLTGQSELFEEDPQIVEFAGQAVKRIRTKQKNQISENVQKSLPDVQPVDLNSITASESRSIGAEYVCHSFWQRLGFPEMLCDAGVTADMQKVIEATVIGRLVSPGSELHTYNWAEKHSALYELTGAPQRYGLPSFYRAGDVLLKHKEHLEKQLSKQEKSLYKLSETICLFDLTNTYFEGRILGNPKAKRGRSKEKRSDCKLLTLALIIDGDGFIKCSRLYSGNQYEAHTLQKMILDLKKLRPDLGADQTVVMDAGISTAENIKWLQEQEIPYITVSRQKGMFNENDLNDMQTIRHDNKGFTMEVKRCQDKGEAYVLCKSSSRQCKDSGIRSRQEKLFIGRLQELREGLQHKGCTKRYSKILESIGRLREKYPRVSKMYQVSVMPESKSVSEEKRKAVDITWNESEVYQESISFEGSYVLRTDRLDLTDKAIWELYIMLTRIESAFRSMKSSLGMRPIFHSKEERSDAHLFITVLAYHILHAIEWESRNHGDNRFWSSIREELSTHQRLTVEFDQHAESGIQHKHLRMCTRAEPGHTLIYRNLGLENMPLPKKMWQLENLW